MGMGAIMTPGISNFHSGDAFEPLGMKDTGFTVPPEKFDRFPTCYWKHMQTGGLAVFDPPGSESFMTKQVPGSPRGVGWDGGYGTCAYWDPQTGVTAIFLSQRLMESPSHPEIFRKFFDDAYPAAGV